MVAKTALVTGGCGFIGHHLANALHDRGYKVSVIDNFKGSYKKLRADIDIELINIDNYCNKRGYDYVYHLAGLNDSDFCDIFDGLAVDYNITATHRMLGMHPNSRFIFASCQSAAELRDVYGITKRAAEHLVNLHRNAVSVRFPYVFGENQLDMTQAVPAYSYALKRNKKIIIQSNQSTCDYLYVGDLVEELISIGESRIKGQTETGYNTPITCIDLYRTIASIAKKKENFRLGEVKKRMMKPVMVKHKINEPKYGFMEGLRRTVRWYLEEESF